MFTLLLLGGIVFPIFYFAMAVLLNKCWSGITYCKFHCNSVEIVLDALILKCLDPSALCGKIRLVKRASTNDFSANTVYPRHELCWNP